MKSNIPALVLIHLEIRTHLQIIHAQNNVLLWNIYTKQDKFCLSGQVNHSVQAACVCWTAGSTFIVIPPGWTLNTLAGIKNNPTALSSLPLPSRRTRVQDLLCRSHKWERTGVTLIMCPPSRLRLEETWARLIILGALLGHGDGGLLGSSKYRFTISVSWLSL